MGLVAVGCAAEQSEQGEQDADAQLGTVASPIYTDTSPANLMYKVEIKNRATGGCLEVVGGVAALGVRVNEAVCARSRAQSFHLLQSPFGSTFQIVSRQAQDLCVGVSGNSAPNGTSTVLVPCRDPAGITAMANTLYRLDNLVDPFNPVTSEMGFRFASIAGPTGNGTACLDGDINAPPPPPLAIPAPSPIPGIIPKNPPPPRLFPMPRVVVLGTLGCSGGGAQRWTVTNWS